MNYFICSHRILLNCKIVSLSTSMFPTFILTRVLLHRTIHLSAMFLSHILPDQKSVQMKKEQVSFLVASKIAFL